MTQNEAPLRIVLADDEPLMLAGLAAILNAQPDIGLFTVERGALVGGGSCGVGVSA